MHDGAPSRQRVAPQQQRSGQVAQRPDLNPDVWISIKHAVCVKIKCDLRVYDKATLLHIRCTSTFCLSPQVLKDLHLEVHPGEIVALVGPSGGGKSSIVKLVERFYTPNEGEGRSLDTDSARQGHTWRRA